MVGARTAPSETFSVLQIQDQIMTSISPTSPNSKSISGGSVHSSLGRERTSASRRSTSLGSERFDEHGRRIVASLTPFEAKSLELGWDIRHHVGFSKGNHEIHPMHRSYFDRTRELENMAPGPKQGPFLESSFLLEPKHHSAARLKVPPLMEPVPPAPPGAYPHKNVWNRRHHETHSKGNMYYHDKDRELFSRFVETKGTRTVQQKLLGITVPSSEDGYGFAGLRNRRRAPW